jgi:four helix bundle protein
MERKYDLEERTLKFSKEIIHLCKALPNDRVNFRLVDQVMRSGPSMGANYREANQTETKKDFRFKIRICLKEGNETIYWLELIKEANPNLSKLVDALLQENSELIKIFASILSKSK